ncbi:NAD(P)H-dependent flavin oxidoreductase [Psychrobacter sp. FDAARGOS_221]|uniref:NAD(P)H-dependent flavin oxidoreductase n=1 Tax=Psychrobacter sp. FDAARGOS_221 TaxID=1975705 RepID=UPI000BB52BF3|nr:nitronate monooxygenase [Psychrobacter sp. FDAARGOS_221]PNK60803.1 nitronate monooxygenase [Psychrobacter sp. FDAARGOS_221]
MSTDNLLTTLNLTCPIVQAPMAGGATTPKLIAAVSNFGGLGSLGAGMTAPDTINEQINQIKALTDKPFAVNLMVLSAAESTTFDTSMPDWLSGYYQKASIEPVLADKPAQLFDEQFQVLLDNPVAVASFTFGIISQAQVDVLHAVGTKVVGTANHPLEAKAWADIGADAVCVQGAEAGGHRGGWLAQSEQDPMGLLVLISQTKAITDVPLIAAGGIMTADAIKAVQTAGAALAQMGTVFLTTTESGISATYKSELLKVANGQRDGRTRLTRLFSGKQARGLVNDYLEQFAAYDNTSLPAYPQLNAMTKPMRAAAAQASNPEYMSLWAGQGVSQVQALSVHELMTQLTGV